MKCGRLRDGDQIPTRPVTIREVMQAPAFERGVADARAGRGFPRDYDEWSAADKPWSYERGRMWACLVPRNVPFKRNGKITDEAIRWFRKFSREIL